MNWLTKRQNCVALSSAEAEFISAANTTQETIWIIQLLQELDLEQKPPITIFEENQSTIKLIESDKNHSRIKHVDIKYNLIKDHYHKVNIILQYLPTVKMTADVLTKPLNKQSFQSHGDNMNLRDN